MIQRRSGFRRAPRGSEGTLAEMKLRLRERDAATLAKADLAEQAGRNAEAAALRRTIPSRSPFAGRSPR